ncbi:Cytochrome P450 2B11 like protein [Argiope bruennichi]|uniref:Cytochrome P450 2B11 like protein n=1 Tax=Argiope bruennichi TaxID=94029 RepID=A0A8T0F8P6_ARGBR|nr:Cytochrome P450 2B11 like protein [Argiope bruennichi]
MNLEKILNYLNLDLSSGTGGLSLLIATLILINVLQKLVKWCIIGRKKPPGPSGFPIVGYLPFLGKEPHKTFWNLRKKYGNIIGVQLGSKYTVVLNDYSTMKEILCHPAALNRAPDLFAGIGAEGLFTANGERWVEQRKYVMSTARDLGLGKGRWEDLIMEEIQVFTEKLKDLKGQPTDIYPILSYSLISNIVILLTGRRLTDVDKIKLCLEFTDLALIFTSPSLATSLVPGLRKFCEFFRIAGYDRYSKVNKKFAEFMIEQINYHKTVPEYMNQRDFINSYLETLSEMSKSGRKKHYFSETELRGHLTALLLGGSDTIFSSLTWLFRLMCQHKDVQDKVYKELIEAFGKDGRARYDERDKIPYTFAVIMEGQRYGSIVPLSGTRFASQDIPVKGYVIPKNTEIFANLWAIHYDPAYWDEPEVFKPERFLSADGTQLVKPSTHYVPFSIGRRNCPGETIALMEILFYFTETVKHFEISTPPGVKPEFEIVNGLVARLVPQALCFKERNN